MSEREKTNQLIAEWSQKLQMPVTELQQKLQQYYQQIAQAHPKLDPDQVERRARFMLYRELKTMLRFPGMVQWDGIFLGYNAKMDVFARRRQQALELFKVNPTLAIQQGLVDATGKPIFKMPSGQTIDISQPVYLRQSVGLFRPASGGDWKLGIMMHRGDLADVLPPLTTPVRFAARKTTEFPDKYVCSMTSATKFTPIEVAEFPDVTDEIICDILRKAPTSLKATCSTLPQWHQQHAQDNYRIVIVEGDVVFIRREPTRTGNAFFVLEDETLMDLTAEGIMCWVHPEIFSLLNFGAGSHVFVIGRTVSMPGWDPVNRTVDTSKQRIGINVFGVYAEPEFRVPPEEETILSVEVQ